MLRTDRMGRLLASVWGMIVEVVLFWQAVRLERGRVGR